MISIEEMEVLLDDIAGGIPQDLYRELNGGIILLPGAKRNSMRKMMIFMYWASIIKAGTWADT